MHSQQTSAVDSDPQLIVDLDYSEADLYPQLIIDPDPEADPYPQLIIDLDHSEADPYPCFSYSTRNLFHENLK